MKMLVSDFDDTFHITREGLEENKEAVRKFRNDGNLFIFASGRGYSDFKWVKEQFDLEYDMLILDHGSLIVDCDGNILHSVCIDDKTVNEIKKHLRLEDTRRVFCTSGFEGRAPFDAGNIQKINVWYTDSDITKEVQKTVADKFGDVVNAYIIPPESMEIISGVSGKDVAIEWVRDKLGVESEDIYTIGDGYTDVVMVTKYNGYAVPNAVEPLKEAAGEIIESVAELINRIM